MYGFRPKSIWGTGERKTAPLFCVDSYNILSKLASGILYQMV
jgi:hypothetical protein